MTYVVPKDQGEKLLAAIKRIGVSEYGAQKWLAENLSLSSQSVNKWIKNRQRINAKHVPKLIKILNVDDDYFAFLAHPAILPKDFAGGTNVPVLNWNIDHTLEKANNNSEIPRILCKKSLTADDCFALQLEHGFAVNDISFPAGTYIVIDTKRNPIEGDIVVARKKSVKTRLLKQYHSDGEYSFLVDPNPLYPAIKIDKNITIEGVVVHAQINLK